MVVIGFSIRTITGSGCNELNVAVPAGLTVSSKSDGPVAAWQFDAESSDNFESCSRNRRSRKPFDVIVETQRGLDPLPD